MMNRTAPSSNQYQSSPQQPAAGCPARRRVGEGEPALVVAEVVALRPTRGCPRPACTRRAATRPSRRRSGDRAAADALVGEGRSPSDQHERRIGGRSPGARSPPRGQSMDAPMSPTATNVKPTRRRRAAPGRSASSGAPDARARTGTLSRTRPSATASCQGPVDENGTGAGLVPSTVRGATLRPEPACPSPPRQSNVTASGAVNVKWTWCGSSVGRGGRHRRVHRKAEQRDDAAPGTRASTQGEASRETAAPRG